MNMTEQEIIADCERRFQAGGPGVYVYEPVICKLLSTRFSAKRALELADAGMTVWSRRKVGAVYRWRAAHKA